MIWMTITKTKKKVQVSIVYERIFLQYEKEMLDDYIII
jgi:hypothetical protein